MTIFNILDLMYEMDEKFIVDEDELISKIIKESKDGMDKFTAENVTALLDAENKYSKSIGLFE